MTIVLHELGHGLGFLGSGRANESGSGGCLVGGVTPGGIGCHGYDLEDGLIVRAEARDSQPLIYDRFVVDGQGRDLLDRTVYPNPSNTIASVLISNSETLFIDSETVVDLNGRPAPIATPNPYRGGSSYSHWSEGLSSGTSVALMTPTVRPGEAYQDPGSLTCAFFQDMGWGLGDGCVVLTGGTVDGEAAPPASLSGRLVGSNPFRARTAVEVRLAAPGPVTATLYDALGRRVRTLHDGVLPAGATRLDVEGAGRPAGTYRVGIESAAGRADLVLTRVR